MVVHSVDKKAVDWVSWWALLTDESSVVRWVDDLVAQLVAYLDTLWVVPKAEYSVERSAALTVGWKAFDSVLLSVAAMAVLKAVLSAPSEADHLAEWTADQ